MKHFTTVKDVNDPSSLVNEVHELKGNKEFSTCGKNKTLALIFFNPSLRTRLSTEKAATKLGMNVIMMNVNDDAWNIEFEDGSVMNGNSQEHIKDAVHVISGYCDIMGVRTFAGLENQTNDYSERVLKTFMRYATVPVISLESATLHPLQSLADIATIKEYPISKPKVVVSWAPHPGRLPQAVANSFLEWIATTDAEVTLTHPPGYELSEKFTQNVSITNNQEEAFEDADFVYAKNWSSFSSYGQCPSVEGNWTVSSRKMQLTNNGKFMHCLPIRRNVVAEDTVIDNSLVYRQAKNREFAAEAVIKKLLEKL